MQNIVEQFFLSFLLAHQVESPRLCVSSVAAPPGEAPPAWYIVCLRLLSFVSTICAWLYREPGQCSNCLLCAYCNLRASRLDSSSVPPLRSLVSWAGVLRPHASYVLRTWVVRGSLLAFAVGKKRYPKPRYPDELSGALKAVCPGILSPGILSPGTQMSCQAPQKYFAQVS